MTSVNYTSSVLLIIFSTKDTRKMARIADFRSKNRHRSKTGTGVVLQQFKEHLDRC